MRAKDLWALVPVPSHVVKKVVSACPNHHVGCLCIPKLLGTLVPTILGYHRQVQNVFWYLRMRLRRLSTLAITATNPLAIPSYSPPHLY